jgi:hypothetical protein
MGMMRVRIVFVAAAAAALFVSGALFVPGAQAQTGRNYDVKTMNFDLWCQEQAHLPAARCDKRSPEDEKVFEDYRAQIERYEVPYLQEQQKALTLDRDVLHNDPVDSPAIGTSRGQSQDPNRQPSAPQP